ncbi:hypothetical protein YOLOSWAG_185 [Erwinia phage vB_EamM_Yoloswag]|uniref:Uncharacterized protein n=1 Tax=Erwinia phage vB_EamM_Yoloswag TaxID=1958956 RepID=A0A1S6L3A4_9CAUD|nr:hypothetical protein HOR66_gp185 [Erwinia phage vB_EamM_Yoloswag]AQT28664.1 hypothetical protein YOLOSWAG_185 [Erwinia phage vB_EamM_Yoloswag]
MQLVMGNWHLNTQRGTPEIVLFDTVLDDSQYDLNQINSVSDYINTSAYSRGIVGEGLVNGVVGQQQDKFWLSNFKYQDPEGAVRGFTVGMTQQNRTALSKGADKELYTGTFQSIAAGAKDFMMTRLYGEGSRTVAFSRLSYQNTYNAGSYGGYSWNISFAYGYYYGSSNSYTSGSAGANGSERQPYQTVEVRATAKLSNYGRVRYAYSISYASGTNQILWDSQPIDDNLLCYIQGQLAASDETVVFDCGLTYYASLGSMFKFDQSDFLVGTDNSAVPGTKPPMRFIRKDVIEV